MDAEVIDVDDEHLVGSYNALLVLIWGARTLPEKVARVREQGIEFVKRWSRIAVLVVVEPNSEIPNKAARKELEAFTSVLIPKTVALAYVFEGTGLHAAATRTLMTALMLFGPPSPKVHKVSPTIDAALDFLVPHLAGPEFGSEAERRKGVLSLQKHFDDYRAGRLETVT